MDKARWCVGSSAQFAMLRQKTQTIRSDNVPIRDLNSGKLLADTRLTSIRRILLDNALLHSLVQQ